MPLVSCYRDLAWADIFARSTRSSSEFASLIVSAGYCLLLAFFFSVKLFFLLDLLMFVIYNLF